MIGETLGNFEIISRLGGGGMGEVWLAEQQAVRTRVAIKVLADTVSADEEQVKRFFNEAVAAGKVRHAGIVKIFDVGVEHGRAYLVMEYLEGESLGARIRRVGKLPAGNVAELARQIASVLEATHAAGIVHRDLKPDNIYLVPDRELPAGERVKLLDFGIAKLASAAITALTTGAATLGTPRYMSPEQWRNPAKVDGKTDAYSLGCVVFELACGRPPFLGTTTGEACSQHLMEPPPPARSIAPELPEAFELLIARLLEKEPAMRPAMPDVVAAFARLARDLVDRLPPADDGAHDETVPQPARVPDVTKATRNERPPRSLKPTLIVAGAIALVGAAVAAIAIASSSRSEPIAQMTDASVYSPAEASTEVAVADAVMAPPPPRTTRTQPTVRTPSRLSDAGAPLAVADATTPADAPEPGRESIPAQLSAAELTKVKDTLARLARRCATTPGTTLRVVARTTPAGTLRLGSLTPKPDERTERCITAVVLALRIPRTTETQTLDVTLVLERVAPGFLDVNSTPMTTASIDGKHSKTPWRTEFRSGSYRLQLENGAGIAETIPIIVEAGRVTWIERDFAKQPNAQLGIVRLDANQPATVFLGPRRVGRTPIRLMLPEGTHAIRVVGTSSEQRFEIPVTAGNALSHQIKF